MINGIIKEILKLRSPAIITVVVTAVLFFAFLIAIRKLSFNGPRTRVLGLFVGLKDRSAFHLCFAWTKFMFFAATIISMQIATTGHYLVIGALIIVSSFLAKEFKLIAMEVIGGLLNLGSVWVCSVFVEYIQDVRSDGYVIVAYWIVGLFMILCSAVVFLYEVMNISRERPIFETDRDKE